MGKTVICNIQDIQWCVSRTYGSGYVNPRKPGDRFALTPVEDAKDRGDMGDNRFFDLVIPSVDVAKDIVNEINHEGFHGVFLCEGSGPTKEELADAEQKLREFYHTQVEAADLAYSRPETRRDITDVMRRAGRYLGLEREWLYTVKDMNDCPLCGEKISPKAAKCNKCGAIVDPDKAFSYGLISSEQAAAMKAARKSATH